MLRALAVNGSHLTAEESIRMASTPSVSPTHSARTKAVGAAVLILLVAAAVAFPFLGKPWQAAIQIGFYALVVAVVAVQLRDCLRLATSPAHASKLRVIGVLLALTVLTVVAHLADMLRSDDRDYLRVATDVGVYLALVAALELVKQLLREAPRPAPGERPAGTSAEAAAR
jgi:hypothetical protein